MRTKTFRFKEGTVIADTSQSVIYNATTGEFKETGKFTACLIGGTAWLRPAVLVAKPGSKRQQIFRSDQDALQGAYDHAVAMGFTPTSKPRPKAKAKARTDVLLK